MISHKSRRQPGTIKQISVTNQNIYVNKSNNNTNNNSSNSSNSMNWNCDSDIHNKYNVNNNMEQY